MISRFLFRLSLIRQIGKFPQSSFRFPLRIGISFLLKFFFLGEKNEHNEMENDNFRKTLNVYQIRDCLEYDILV